MNEHVYVPTRNRHCLSSVVVVIVVVVQIDLIRECKFSMDTIYYTQTLLSSNEFDKVQMHIIYNGYMRSR